MPAVLAKKLNLDYGYPASEGPCPVCKKSNVLLVINDSDERELYCKRGCHTEKILSACGLTRDVLKPHRPLGSGPLLPLPWSEEPIVVHDAVGSTIQTADADPPKLVFYDTVEYEEPEFIIKPYVPRGKITIIQADSGVRKTALACKLAACASRGMPMQGEPCTQGKTLILSVEDDPGTLRGRIEASGGDLAQCAFLENAHELTFSSEIIEQVIEEHGIILLIFDPLQAFLGSGMDMHRANETRPIMAHLGAMAKRTGCAVVVLSHMSKGTAGGKAIYRALGSVDIVAASRSVLYVERNPDDEDQCVIVHIKSSNAKTGQSVLYRIGERGGVRWEGYSSITVDDLIMQAERKEKGVDYEDDPLVRVVTMFHQDNPQGAFISWEELDNYANKILGYFPCQNGKDWNARLKKMQREFTERSRIIFEFQNTRLEEHVEFGEKVTPQEKKKERGVRIIPFKPRTEFQIGFGDERDAGTNNNTVPAAWDESKDSNPQDYTSSHSSRQTEIEPAQWVPGDAGVQAEWKVW